MTRVVGGGEERREGKEGRRYGRRDGRRETASYLHGQAIPGVDGDGAEGVALGDREGLDLGEVGGN